MRATISVATLLLALVVAAYGAHTENVLKFKIEQEVKKVLDMLSHLEIRPASTHKSSLGTYKYINCGTSADLMNITTLTATPDPIVFPGTLGIDFAGEFKQTLQAPLKATLVLERKFGDNWIKIPCIGSIGSCTYDDLCEKLAGATCPDPFGTNGVPCKCPFTKGNYKLPKVSFDVDAAVFPPGDYHAKGTLVTGDSGTPTACIELFASFA